MKEVEIASRFFSGNLSNLFFNLDDIKTKFWDSESQNNVLQLTINSKLFGSFPPSITFQVKFFKKLIENIESSGQEVYEEFYEIYTKLLQNNEISNSGYKSYFLSRDFVCNDHEYDRNAVVSLNESNYYVTQGTTGLSTWQAAMYLSEWACSNQSIFYKRNIVELGSGVGFFGCCLLKKILLNSYTFTDCSPAVLANLKKNIYNNFKDSIIRPSNPSKQEETDIISSDFTEKLNRDENEVEISVCQLDWTKASSDYLHELATKTDLIVASDVVYDPSVVPHLVRVITTLLSAGTSNAYIASTLRNNETNQLFIKTIDLAGLTYSLIDGDNVKEIFYYDRTTPIQILHIRNKTSAVS